MKQHRSERSAPPAATLLARLVLLAQVALLAGAPTSARAEGNARQPLWELGLGAAALRLPDYRGADVAHSYLLPLPYVIYRGDWLRAGRDGARAVLIDTPAWVLDISLHASAPVRSHDNPARQGMANLPATVEIGPQLSTTLWRAASGPAHLDLRLPLRSAITLERTPTAVGQVFTPTLNLDLPHVAAGWNLGLQAGLSYGTRRHHEHFYGVSAADATATRPAYQARGGYAGWQTLAALSRRYDQTWVGLFMRYDRLGGAVFADSPLVRQHDALSAGIAFAWVLARSTQEARSDD